MPRVGAYIASIDGERLEKARKLGALRARESVSHAALGAAPIRTRFRTSRSLGTTGEVDGYIYLGQQTPAFYAKQVIASIVNYGMSPAAAVLRRADGLRRARPTSPSTAPAIRAASSIASRPPGQLFFKHFGESIFRNDLCNADVELGDLLIHEGAGGRSAAARGAGLRRRPHLLRAERHDHLQQGRHRTRC